MSASDPTLAQRSRRHRARVQERQAEDLAAALAAALTIALAPVLEALEVLRNGQESLVQAVDNLTPSRSKGGGQPLRNGSGDSGDSASLRNGPRAPARAYTGGTPPPPPLRGEVGGRPDVTVRDDAWRVLQVLTVPGSAGSIVDALGADGRTMTLARVTAALVHLQAQGQVRREEGLGAAPDRWVPVPLEEAPPEPPPARLAILPAVEVHVTCQDYQAHATTHHWDGQAFVCPTCAPAIAVTH